MSGRGASSVEVACVPQPGLQYGFDDVLLSKQLIAVELALKRTPFERSGYLGAEANRYRDQSNRPDPTSFCGSSMAIGRGRLSIVRRRGWRRVREREARNVMRA